jgi:AcrR family transcriptional regulator
LNDQPSEPRYHHGDLRAALLRAGEEELAEKGYAGFTLRGTAKRAGVSHAAPAHHFRDSGALLTALAARGFARLTAAMRKAQAAAPSDPAAQLVASGIGYLRFGLANPALLQLMFGRRRQDADDPELQRNGAEAFGILVDSLSAHAGLAALETPEGRRMIATAWSIAHGFTELATGRRLAFLADDDPAALEAQFAAIISAAIPDR